MDLTQREFSRNIKIPRTTLQRRRATALLLFDIHFPHHHEEHIGLALDYARSKHRVDILLLGGDIVDCEQISRFSRDPFASAPLHETINDAADWLGALAGMFPKSRKIFIEGNHEARLQNYLWSKAPEISRLRGLTIPEQLRLGESGFEYVQNQELKQRTGRFFSLGMLNILHGHEFGICPTVNPARQFFLRGLDNLIFGHIHRVDEHIQTTMNDKTLGAFCAGTLAHLWPAYRPQNNWTAGFALVHFDADGRFSVKLKKIIDGRVL